MKKRGRPKLPKSEVKRRELRVLVTDAEARAFQKAAKAEGVSLSAWLRGIGLEAAEG